MPWRTLDQTDGQIDNIQAKAGLEKLIQALARLGLQVNIRNGDNCSLLVFVKATDDKRFNNEVYKSRYIITHNLILYRWLIYLQSQGLALRGACSSAGSRGTPGLDFSTSDRQRTISDHSPFDREPTIGRGCWNRCKRRRLGERGVDIPSPRSHIQ